MNKFIVASASVALLLSSHNAVAGDADIVDSLLTTSAISCDDIGVEKEQLMAVVAALKAEIVSQLQQGKRVQLDSFGTFYFERMETPVQAAGTNSKIRTRDVLRFEADNAPSIMGVHPRVANVVTNP